MRNITVKYLKQDRRSGSYVYRRRVPKALAGVVSKREFIKVLGKTLAEAMMRYGREHERVEHLVTLAKSGVTGLSPAEQAARLAALLDSWGADPHGKGRDDNERTWREEAANRLVEPYQDADTGVYVGVPSDDAEVAKALLGGVARSVPSTTVTDAFKFYLTENGKDLPEQRKKQVQRLRRSEKNLIFVLGRDKPLSDVTKADARAWRDMRAGQGVSPATIRRERNDIGAVISLAISELDGAGSDNPFHQMKIKGGLGGRQDKRESLEQGTIDGVYKSLQCSPELLSIWTLLDHTGARPSEIRMLRYADIVVEHDVPHIVIEMRPDRTLKSDWSERKIPLVGDALTVAQGLNSQGSGAAYVFLRYSSEGGLDRLSQALTKRVRLYSKDPKHVPYSLRHNMKDRMRRAEIFPETAKAIEGHAFSVGQDGSYGGRFPLGQMQKALQKALAGYREEK